MLLNKYWVFLHRQLIFCINLVGVLCPTPNVTDNLVLSLNKTEYRFGDSITFDCVGDFELSSQLATTRDCVVNETNIGIGMWTGEIPLCQGSKTKYFEKK